MSYDRAWDMPTINWQQQGSFANGTIPPTVEPDAGTQIMLGPIAQEWMPWICGALDQLRNPSAWIVADDAAMYDTLRRVDTLLGLICGSREGCVPVQTRLNNCVLQTSIDGGVTWVDVPGWASGFGACVRQNMPPPIPPNPGDKPIEQHACNLAGYLSTQIIQYSMTKILSGIAGTDPPMDTIRNILDFFPGAALVLSDLTTMMQDFYNTISGGTIAHYTAASTDGSLWSAITCAIYSAIRTVGYVDATNFAQVGINILGVPYVYGEVITAIGFYWVEMGLTGAQALQTIGAVDDVDCSTCGTWCQLYDFTVGMQGWSILPPYAGFYDPGNGWQSGISGGAINEIIIQSPVFSPALTITGANISFCAPNPSGGQVRHYDFRLGGVQQLAVNIDPNARPCGTHSSCGVISVVADQLFIAFRSAGTGAVDTIQSIEIGGNGPNPFGPSNCAYAI